MMCTEDLKGRVRKPVLIFLLLVGCLQMAGDLAGLPAVRAFGLALHASPAAKVFTAQEGFETYSSHFYLDWTDTDGKAHSLHITPDVYYHGVKGPYNRRNAYGAALSYGPVLSRNPKTLPMFEEVAHFALCGDAPILSELGIDPQTVKGPVTIRLVPRQKLPANHTWKLKYDIACS
jgi:hypothetical protein